MHPVFRERVGAVVIAALLCVAAAWPVRGQESRRIYMVGNSVTDGVNYGGFESLATSAGNAHVWGRQMIPGAPLGLLWDSQDGFTTSPYGAHTNALTNYQWDCVTLQPFDRSLASDSAIIGNFIGEAKAMSPDVQFYIMGRWPRSGEAPATAAAWEELWLGTFSGSYQTNETRQFFEDLADAVRAANTDVKPVCVIPVGEVFFELNRLMDAGSVSGFSSAWDLYADGIHMNGTGSYATALTFFATMYQQDPRGLGVPSQFGSIDAGVVAAIQQTVYDVVFTYAYSGTTLDDLVPADGVSVSPGTLDIGMLQSGQLSAVVSPASAANKRVTWVSNNTDIAIVDKAGMVTGVGNGTCDVVAVTNDGGFRDSCTVTVTGSLSGTTEDGTLAAWDFTGSIDAVPVVATTSMTGVSTDSPSLDATLGDGANVSAYVGEGLYASGLAATDLTQAIAGNEYYSFTVVPGTGKLLTIDSLHIATRSQNVDRTFVVFSSLFGFGEDKAIQSIVSGWSAFTTVPITGHTNVPDPVEFRVYVFGPANQYESAGIGGHTGDDFAVFGSIFTPEDAEGPTAPTNLAVSRVKHDRMHLSWDAATDDMVVWGYHVLVDGTPVNSSLVRVTSYDISGLTTGTTYTLTVRAVDFVGNESVASSPLDVMTNRQPTAAISASPQSGTGPLTVSFSAAAATDPDTVFGDYILGFEWDFGDGSELDFSNAPEHEYTQSGQFTVTLRVMDSRDMYSEPVTTTISVGPVGVSPRLSANLHMGRTAQVLVADLQGRTVAQSTQMVRRADEAVMPALPSGMYVVRIRLDGEDRLIGRLEVTSGGARSRVSAGEGVR